MSAACWLLPAPGWSDGSCGHHHGEDGEPGAWPEDQRDWPRMWTVAEAMHVQRAGPGSAFATLPAGTVLRLDGTLVQIAATAFGGEVDVSHRFGVVGGPHDGGCFYVSDGDPDRIRSGATAADRLPRLRPLEPAPGGDRGE